MKGKKLIAFLLAFFMLAGLVPAAPAGLTAAAAPADFSIDLSKAWVSGGGDYQAVAAKIDTHGWEINEEMTVANYYGAGNGGREQDSNNMNLASSGFNIMFAARTTPNNLTLNIKAPAAGAYNLKLNALHHSYGATVAVFVNQKYMGIVNTNTGTTWTTTPLHSVELTAGVNTITFMRMSGKTQLLLKDIIFEGIEALPTFDKMSIEADTTTVNVNDTLDITAGALLSDGSYKFINGYKYIGVDQISTGSKDTGNTGELTSSNTDVATVALDTTAPTAGQPFYGEMNYKLTAHKAGITRLIFSGYIDGELKSVSKIIAVVDPNATAPANLSIDLTAAITDSNYHPVTETVETAGWGINEEMTVANYYGAGNGQRKSNENTVALHSSFMDIRMGTAKEIPNDFTLDIYAPEAGTYDFTLNCYQLPTYGSEVAVFVNEEYAGDFTTTASSAGYNDFPLKRVWLNQGINTVTFTRLGGGVQFLPKVLKFTNGVAGTGYEYDKTVLTLDKSIIKVGETMTVKGGALMSNGEYRWMNGFAFTGVDSVYDSESNVQKNICELTSSNTAVGTVEVVGSTKAGELTYTFTAVEAGYTELTLNTKVDGVNRSKTVVINVVEDNDIPANFGNTYAYIREVNDGRTTSYKLVLLSAIDSLDYKKVGFKIDGDIGVSEKVTQNVYNSIVVNGTTYTAADFGLTAEDYIFSAELDITPAQAGEVIAFNAFATPLEGDEIAGAARAISVVAE